jgi:hypothetical protein
MICPAGNLVIPEAAKRLSGTHADVRWWEWVPALRFAPAGTTGGDD